MELKRLDTNNNNNNTLPTRVIRRREKEKEKEKERERLTCFDGVLERVRWMSKWNTDPSFIFSICLFVLFCFFFFNKKKRG